MAIVKGDRLSGSEKLAAAGLGAALAYPWFISNQGVTDDFGRGRLAPASLWAKVFEKRIELGLVADVTADFVALWFVEWERVGLVKCYLWGGDLWFEWANFQGVPPTKQRYHRAPEPPWTAHACSRRCERSARKFSKVLISQESTTAAVLGSRTAAALGTYSVFCSPSSSVPLRPHLPTETTDYNGTRTLPADAGRDRQPRARRAAKQTADRPETRALCDVQSRLTDKPAAYSATMLEAFARLLDAGRTSAEIERVLTAYRDKTTPSALFARDGQDGRRGGPGLAWALRPGDAGGFDKILLQLDGDVTHSTGSVYDGAPARIRARMGLV